MTQMKVQYFFRRPKFPLLLASDTIVIGAKNSRELNKWITKLTFQKDDAYDVIDGNAEGWAYYPKYNVISPLTLNKQWTKRQIIDLYNLSIQNEDNKEEYIAKSLSNKKLSTIVEEIVELARKP